MNAIVELSAAEEALARAQTVTELLTIRAKVNIIVDALRTIDEMKELATHATVIRIRAERQIGEWLNEYRPWGGSSGGDHDSLDVGVTRDQARRWRLVAQLPQDRFDEWIDERIAKGWDISTAGIIRFAQNHHDKHSGSPAAQFIRVPPIGVCWLRGYLRDCDGPITGGHIIHKGEVRGNGRARAMLAACPDEIMAPQCVEHNVGRWANTREAKRILLVLKIYQLGYPRMRSWFDEFEATFKVLPPELTLGRLLDVPQNLL